MAVHMKDGLPMEVPEEAPPPPPPPAELTSLGNVSPREFLTAMSAELGATLPATKVEAILKRLKR